MFNHGVSFSVIMLLIIGFSLRITLLAHIASQVCIIWHLQCKASLEPSWSLLRRVNWCGVSNKAACLNSALTNLTWCALNWICWRGWRILADNITAHHGLCSRWYLERFSNYIQASISTPYKQKPSIWTNNDRKNRVWLRDL